MRVRAKFLMALHQLRVMMEPESSNHVDNVGINANCFYHITAHEGEGRIFRARRQRDDKGGTL